MEPSFHSTENLAGAVIAKFNFSSVTPNCRAKAAATSPGKLVMKSASGVSFHNIVMSLSAPVRAEKL